VVCLGALTACGSSDSSSTGSNSNSAGCVAAAKKVVDAGRADVAPFVPTAAVDAAKSKGKTVWLIQNSLTPLVAAVTKGFQDAAKDVGVNVKVVSGNGSIPTIVSAVSQAVAQKADGIVLFAVSTTSIAAQAKEAKAAGIPIVDTYNDNSGQDLSAQGFFGHVTADYAAGGRMIAAWEAEDSGCKLKSGILGASALPPHKDQQVAASAELKKLCSSSCKSEFVNLDLTKLATDAGPQAQQLLRRNPDMKYIHALFDAAVTFIAPSVQQSGRTDVKAASMGGDAAALERVRSGKSMQKAVVAIAPQEYQGYAFMDQILRGMTGAPAVNWKLPIRFIDSSNVGSSDDSIFAQFNGVEKKFESTWGVN
jgi:ribose transport system substrate-binding protein